jgi:hypothetical protein
VASWADQTSDPALVRDICSRFLLDALSGPEPAAFAAALYLSGIGEYFSQVPRSVAAAVASWNEADRVGANLALFSLGGYGSITEAMELLPDADAGIPLRVAAAHVLGLSAYSEANRVLSETAGKLEGLDPRFQRAVIEGLVVLSQRAAPGQVLRGLQAAFESRADPEVRAAAATGFLHIVAGMTESVRDRYAEGVVVARRVLADAEAS